MQAKQALDIESYPSMLEWREQLRDHAKDKKLRANTWRRAVRVMNLVLESRDNKVTPDDLIQEGLQNPKLARRRVDDFLDWLRDNKSETLGYNAAVGYSHGTYRAFYKHNGISTQNWAYPVLEQSKVNTADDNCPMFIPVQMEGTKEEMLVLNRPLLQVFYGELNPRDKAIFLCIESGGEDPVDLLSLTIGEVAAQSNFERIMRSRNRTKSSVPYRTFYSKEATAVLRNYIAVHRKYAEDSEPVFVASLKEAKIQFKIKHGFEWTARCGVDLPKLDAISEINVQRDFRRAQSNMKEIILTDNEQGPIRPKRGRKIFDTACSTVNIPLGVQQTMMGHDGDTAKIYLGKSRAELELYYKKLEPALMVLSEPPIKIADEVLIRKNEQLEIELAQANDSVDKKIAKEMDKLRQEFQKLNQ